MRTFAGPLLHQETRVRVADHWRWLWLQICLIAILFLAAPACTSEKSLAGRFLVLESDNRILYEHGAEAYARELLPFLPAAISKVEAAQYLPFYKPVKVYVCASAETCHKLTGSRAPAVTTDNVFLSPVLFQEKRPLDRYLTHELAHLHIEQRLGLMKFRLLPAWFKEGLAEYVAGGATGARVTDEETYDAIRKGRTFVPDDGRNVVSALLFPRYGSHWGISEALFYRQSMLFIAFLRNTDEGSFRKLLLAIQQGQSFRTALAEAYHQPLSALWEEFVAEISGKGK